MMNAPATKTWLASNNVTCRADLFTVTLLDGTIFRWTPAETDLVVGGVTFKSPGASAPLVKRGPIRQSARLSIDTLDVTLVGGSFLIGGQPIGLKAAQGYFDGGRLQLDHIIMPSPGDVSLGSISSFFEGRVSTVEPQGPQVLMRIKSELVALNINLPRFFLQTLCGNAVYDSNCTMVKATFTDAGAASGVPTKTSVASTTAAIVAKANGYYNLGVMVGTSGVNNGLRRAVSAFSVSGGTGTFTLALPFPVASAAGDTFTVYPGCDRSRATCNTKFANLAHYRGYPHIPTPEAGGKP